MKSELSQLVDGELDEARHAAVLNALRENASLRSTWHDYQLIGDALRHTNGLSADLTNRVMLDLQHEPTLLVPQSRAARAASAANEPRWLRHAAAMAGVAVVGWLAWSSPQSPTSMLKPLNTVSAKNSLTSVAPVDADSAAFNVVAVAEQSGARTLQSPASTLSRTRVSATQSRQNEVEAERLQSYLLAHQAYSPAHRLDGGAAYMRTVAAHQ